MIKFVTFGETMIQYNAEYIGPYNKNGSHISDIAGAESNVAINLNRLSNDDLQTIWISRLGNDKEGTLIADSISSKIEMIADKYQGEKTGVSYLNHYDNNVHKKEYDRKGSAASKITYDLVSPHIDDANLVHLTGITPALGKSCYDTIFKTIERCNELNIPISFDVNYREQLWSPEEARKTIDQIRPSSTIFKLGYDEAERIWNKGLSPKEYVKFFYSNNVIILTNDSDPTILYDGSNLLTIENIPVNAIDPIGAGDAFMSGFIHSILTSKKHIKEILQLNQEDKKYIFEKALKIGNICGSLTCTSKGDTSAMPTLKTVNEYLSKYY